MGHGGAQVVGDEGGLGEGATLVAGGAQATLLAGKREEIFVAAVWAMKSREAGVEIATLEELRDGGRGFGMQKRKFVRVIVEDLPDRGGARLAGAVAGADHSGTKGGHEARRLPEGTKGALYPNRGIASPVPPRFHGTCSSEHSLRPRPSFAFAGFRTHAGRGIACYRPGDSNPRTGRGATSPISFPDGADALGLSDLTGPEKGVGLCGLW